MRVAKIEGLTKLAVIYLISPPALLMAGSKGQEPAKTTYIVRSKRLCATIDFWDKKNKIKLHKPHYVDIISQQLNYLYNNIIIMYLYSILESNLKSHQKVKVGPQTTYNPRIDN